MTKPRRGSRKKTADPHPIDKLFAGKLEEGAKEAYRARRAKDIARLGPRHRMSRALFDAFKVEQGARTSNGFSASDDRVARDIERLLKPFCKRYGLEPDDNKKEKKERGED